MRYGERKVGTDPMRVPTNITNKTFGGADAAALQQLGQGVQYVSDIAADHIVRYKDRADKVLVHDALVEYEEAKQEIMNTATALKGVDGINMAGRIQKDLDALKNKATESLSSQNMKNMFRASADPSHLQSMKHIFRVEQRNIIVHEQITNEAEKEIAIDKAKIAPGDKEVFKESLFVTTTNTRNQTEHLGKKLSDAMIAVAKANLYTHVIKHQMLTDPKGALAFFEANLGKFGSAESGLKNKLDDLVLKDTALQQAKELALLTPEKQLKGLNAITDADEWTATNAYLGKMNTARDKIEQTKQNELYQSALKFMLDNDTLDGFGRRSELTTDEERAVGQTWLSPSGQIWNVDTALYAELMELAVTDIDAIKNLKLTKEQIARMGPMLSLRILNIIAAANKKKDTELKRLLTPTKVMSGLIGSHKLDKDDKKDEKIAFMLTFDEERSNMPNENQNDPNLLFTMGENILEEYHIKGGGKMARYLAIAAGEQMLNPVDATPPREVPNQAIWLSTTRDGIFYEGWWTPETNKLYSEVGGLIQIEILPFTAEETQRIEQEMKELFRPKNVFTTPSLEFQFMEYTYNVGVKARLDKLKQAVNNSKFVDKSETPPLDRPMLEDSFDTHRMMWAKVQGKFIAFPTTVMLEGNLIELPPKEALRYALKTTEYITFPSAYAADAYARGPGR